jgi:hypothetical protein
LSCSAHACTCASSVKMLVFVKHASLSGDSTRIVQPRGETTAVKNKRLHWANEELTVFVDDDVHAVLWCALLSYDLDFLERSLIDRSQDHQERQGGRRRCRKWYPLRVYFNWLSKKWHLQQDINVNFSAYSSRPRSFQRR